MKYLDKIRALGGLTIPEAVASTPATDELALYTKSDRNLYLKGDDGIEKLIVSDVVSPWAGLPYLNGWEDYGGLYRPGLYRKVGNKVELRGLIKDLGTHAAADPMFQLPVGFRPSAWEILDGVANTQVTSAASAGTAHTHNVLNLSVRIQIDSSGNATLGSAAVSTGFISLSNLYFYND